MLTNLQIRNFQCHKQLDLDLDEKITTVIGPSDRGKSAVIRALRWLCTNKPSGDAFVRDGAKLCQVVVGIDGKGVLRRRSSSVNKYAFDEREYASFGSDVPEPVADFLNVGPVNFQGQHDAPFWLSDTAGQVSRNLNAIVNLDVIDKAMAEVARRVSKARARAEVIGERVEQTRERKRSLVWVKQAKADLKSVDRKRAEAAKKEAEAVSLGRLLAEGIKTREARDCRRRAVQTFSGVLRRAKRLMRSEDEATRLGSLVEDAGRWKRVEAPDTSRLEESAAAYNEVDKEVKGIWNRMDQIKFAMERSKDCQLEADKARRELEDKMGGTCPLCGAEMVDVK